MARRTASRTARRTASRIVTVVADLAELVCGDLGPRGRTETSLEALIAGSPDVILVVSADGTILYASTSAERAFGYPQGSRIGTNVFDLVHPDDACRAVESLTNTAVGSGVRQPLHVRVRRRDLTWVDVEVVANNGLEDPLIGGVVLNVRDISERREAQLALERERELVRAVLDTTGALVVVLTMDGRIMRFNRAAERLTGCSFESVVGRPFEMFVPPEDAAGVAATVAELQAGDFPNTHENRWLTKSGEARLVLWFNTLILEGDGRPACIVSTGIDVTEARQATEAMREAEARFRGAFDNAPIGMALLSVDGSFVQVNRELCDLVGRDEAQLVGLPMTEVVHPEDRPGHASLLAELVEGPAQSCSVEHRFPRPDGQVRWATTSVSAVRSGNGEPLHLVAQCEDVTDRRALREELAHRAMHDPLTGLANRTLLLENLERGLTRLDGDARSLAVVFIDLDGFKEVNDRFGHGAGDRLLVIIAHRLRAAARKGDTVARLGGDEFVVVCHQMRDAHEMELRLDRIRAAFHDPVSLPEATVPVAASAGVAVAINGRTAPETLLDEADRRMYEAKHGFARPSNRRGAGSTLASICGEDGERRADGAGLADLQGRAEAVFATGGARCPTPTLGPVEPSLASSDGRSEAPARVP